MAHHLKLVRGRPSWAARAAVEDGDLDTDLDAYDGVGETGNREPADLALTPEDAADLADVEHWGRLSG